ncbi:LLM class flavin-dependent oxidoreductase, partial [Streptomyces albus]|uniref:LLM class flavin-dependent oxidoreductase n=1 Tax=Streptomyces albus TaxID=1888 RepID=UPI00340B62EF
MHRQLPAAAVPPPGPVRRAPRPAGCAEEAGLDDVWLAEHHFVSYGVCPSAVTLAAL